MAKNLGSQQKIWPLSCVFLWSLTQIRKLEICFQKYIIVIQVFPYNCFRGKSTEIAASQCFQYRYCKISLLIFQAFTIGKTMFSFFQARSQDFIRAGEVCSKSRAKGPRGRRFFQNEGKPCKNERKFTFGMRAGGGPRPSNTAGYAPVFYICQYVILYTIVAFMLYYIIYNHGH